MYKYIGLYFLAILGFIIELESLGNWVDVSFKLIVFIGISYLLYSIWKDNSAEVEESDDVPGVEEETSKSEAQDTLVFDIKPSQWVSVYSTDDILKHFTLNQFLIAWNLIFPENGYIFLLSVKGQNSLLFKRQKQEYDWPEDMPLKAVLALLKNSNGFLLENDIPNAGQLFPIYKEKGYDVRSVLGVSTPLSDNEQLFWLFDSESVGHFQRSDSQIIQKAIENLSLFYQNRVFNSKTEGDKAKSDSLLTFALKLNSARSIEESIEHLSESIAEQFEATKLTIALLNFDTVENNTAIIKKALGGSDPYRYGFEFPLDAGLNGWVIQKNKPYLIDSIDKGEYFIPRYTTDETSNFDIRAFLSVPIAASDKAFGMITLEDKQENKFINEDKEKLKQTSEIFAQSVKRFLGDHFEYGGING